MTARTTVYIDVSDLLRHGLTTGIQRVVRQVVPRLVAGADDELDIQMLRFDPAGHVYDELDVDSMVDVLRGKVDQPTVTGRRRLDEFGSSDVFLDLDSAWNSPLKRSTLYPLLKSAGVTIVSYVYDLVPLKVPEVVHETTLANWIVYLSAVLAHSDLVMTDSRCAERDFLDVKAELGVVRPIPTLVTRLGSDLPEVDKPSPVELDSIKQFRDQRFLLFVGTIEPRKQHLQALAAFDLLAEEYPDLHMVFAGRRGWVNDETMPTIEGHPLYGRRLHWVEAPTDALLVKLYERATACVYLSKYEGFGLPIAESLGHGRITVASRNSSMYEVGREACDYTYFDSAAEVAETLAQYLSDPRLLEARERYIREHFKPLGWDTVTATIDTALRGLAAVERRRLRPRPEKIQFVLISNNPEKLERAIPLWDARSSIVKEYVVVAPPSQLDRIRRIRSRSPLVVVDENRILAGRESEFRNADHVQKNWMLRSGLVDLREVDDLFVMLDDDSLPLAEVRMDAFLTDEGRMRAYYFFDLIRWSHRVSDFDDGQRASCAALAPHGFELLAYSSHQPQIFDKQLFRETVDWTRSVGAQANLGEWDTYFNYSVTRYPTLFDKQVFRALGWPGRATDWTNAYPPQQPLFENFYSKAYSIGRFKDLKPGDPAELKIARKEREFAPFRRSARIFERSRRIIARDDLAHGAVRFACDGFDVLVGGLPQLVTIVESSNVRLDIAFHILRGPDRRRHQIGIGYQVDGGPVRAVRIRIRSDAPQSYETGAASLAISGGRAGTYEIEFVLTVDGEEVRPAGRRYLATLVVLAPGERPRERYDELADSLAGSRSISRRWNRFVDKMAPARQEQRAQVERIATDLARTRSALDAMPEAIAALSERQHRMTSEISAIRGGANGSAGGVGALEALAQAIAHSGRNEPVFGIVGLGTRSPGQLEGRARAIEDHVGRMVGKRILVIGSGFGYLPMYFAVRGARTTGWDPDVASCAVAREAARLTGSTAAFASAEDLAARIAAIQPHQFDLAIVDPSAEVGATEPLEWLPRLCDRVPVVIHDGAPGQTLRADDPRQVIGQFGPPGQSEEHHPLIVVQQPKVVVVGGHVYPYEQVRSEAYHGSPMARQDRLRRYYFHPDHVVKEYQFGSLADQELKQSLREIDLHVGVLGSADIWHHAPLIDFEIGDSIVRSVHRGIRGTLLSDLAPVGGAGAVRVARDLIRTLGDLAGLGLHHNDVRSWNVIVHDDDASGWLIDYGLASYRPVESDLVSLMWVLNVALTGQREGFEVGKEALPDRGPFEGTGLEALYDLVAAGESDWESLRASIRDA